MTGRILEGRIHSGLYPRIIIIIIIIIISIEHSYGNKVIVNSMDKLIINNYWTRLSKIS